MANPKVDVHRSEYKPDITIEEAEADTVVDREILNRASELMARWALRLGEKVLEKAGPNLENRVTPNGIKDYGDRNGSN